MAAFQQGTADVLKEQLMYYYSGKNKTCHPATSHRSAVSFPYICAIACTLFSRSSLVLVIFCRYIINTSLL